MPYIVHFRSAVVEDRDHYFSTDTYLEAWRAIALSVHSVKADAIVARTGNDQIITYVPSVEEREKWKTREYARLYRYEGVDVPYVKLPIRTFGEHYVHYAIGDANVGKIAFTPDDTYGHEDRQLVTTIGRYLDKYGEQCGYDKSEHADLIARVMAVTLPLKFAATADEIGRVYCAPRGPSSCMAGDKGWSYRDSPTRVYAGGDLQVAYIGALDANDPAKDQISARAVVWPDKRHYVRTYGAEDLIEQALQRAGYSHAGSFEGARISCVQARGSYVMPYVDGNVQTARLDFIDGKDWFVVDDDGSYGLASCNGYIDAPNDYLCARDGCDNSVDEDGNYCDSCNDDRWTCDSCYETYFNDDCRNSHDYGTFCDSCNDTGSHRCEVCDETFHTHDYSPQQRRHRAHWDLCDDCIDDHDQCVRCHNWSDDLAPHGTADDLHCTSCRRQLSQPRPRPRAVVLRRASADRPVLPRLVARRDHSVGYVGEIYWTAVTGVYGRWVQKFTPITFDYAGIEVSR